MRNNRQKKMVKSSSKMIENALGRISSFAPWAGSSIHPFVSRYRVFLSFHPGSCCLRARRVPHRYIPFNSSSTHAILVSQITHAGMAKLADAADLKTGRTFREAAEQYLREYDIIAQGQRSKTYLRGEHS